MSYRASERVANLIAGKELSNMDVQLAIKDNKRNSKLDERMAQITRMLEDNPSIIVKERSFACYDPRYDSSVIQSLEKLVYDANAENDKGANHGHPWWGRYHSALSVRRFIGGLRAEDKYQQAFRNNAADSVSIPTTVGMLTRLGLPNKDLKQLLSSAIQPDGSLDWAFDRAISEVIDRCKSHFLEELANGSPNSDMYEILPDGRVKLVPWTIEVMKREMSNSLSKSSPGYPYIGNDWSTVLDSGKTVLQECFDGTYDMLGNYLLDKTMPEPFLFIQGCRHTSDAGFEASDAAQRLVQMACLLEKFLGHMLSRPSKSTIRYHGSGQLGEQEASKWIMKTFQPTEANKLTHATDHDVSRFDAHVGDYQHEIFWTILDAILDCDDHFTRAALRCYRYAYNSRELVTAVGNIITPMLPSGASITTIFAFYIHEVYIRAANHLHQSRYNSVGWVHWTIQGDDFAAATDDPRISEASNEVYNYVGCEIKGTSRFVSLKDPDAAISFLGVLIGINNGKIYRVPKGKFWWGEDAATSKRQILDNIIRREVLESCTNPSEREQHFASFEGKIRNFVDQPFFQYLFDYVMRENKGMKLRSWLGERVCPQSEIISYLRAYESSVGIIEPSEKQKIIDREQSDIPEPSAIALAFAAALILHKYELDDLGIDLKRFYAYTRSTKKIRPLVEKVIPDPHQRTSDDEKIEQLTAELTIAITSYFDTACETISQEEIDKLDEAKDLSDDIEEEEIKTPKKRKSTSFPADASLLKKLLAGLQENPFEVKARFADAIVDCVSRGVYHQMRPMHQIKLEEAFEALTGGDFGEILRDFTPESLIDGVG